MLQQNEVKIGNLLSYMDDVSYVIVEEVYNGRVKVIRSVKHVPDRIIHFPNLAGVKITREILLNLGFKDSGILNTLEFPQILITEENGFWYHGHHQAFDKRFPLEYIHQLQNLYKEKLGKELDVDSFFSCLSCRINNIVDGDSGSM